MRCSLQNFANAIFCSDRITRVVIITNSIYHRNWIRMKNHYRNVPLVAWILHKEFIALKHIVLHNITSFCGLALWTLSSNECIAPKSDIASSTQTMVSTKSPDSQLFTQPFIRGQIKESIRAGGPMNSPHKWPVTRKMFSFDDIIMTATTMGCPCLKIFFKWWLLIGVLFILKSTPTIMTAHMIISNRQLSTEYHNEWSH